MGYLDDFKFGLQKFAHKVYDHRADITFFGGVGLTMFGTGLFIKATNDLQPEFKDHKEKMNSIESDLTKTPEEKKAVKTEICKHTFVVTVKAYAAPVIVSGVGYVAQFYSHSTMKSDLSAASAALSAATAAYETLKQRIIEKEGPDKWREYAYGQTVESVIDINAETGEQTERSEAHYDSKLANPYVKIFDETNHNWEPSKGSNRRTLMLIERSLNDQLRLHGVLMYHEALRQLGYDLFEDGKEETSKAGWVYKNADGSTNYISLGLESQDEATVAFMQDRATNVLLEFNCVPNVFVAMR